MERIHHNRKSCCKGIKSAVFGLTVVAAGVVLMLRNLEMIDPFWSNVLISWPALIMALGFVNLFGREFPFGLVVFIAGGFFMASKFFGLPFEFSQIIWPSVIILVGLLILAGSRFIIRKKFEWSSSDISEDAIEEVNVFGGSNHIITSKNFKGGKMVNVFGGSKIDFLQTELAPEGSQMEMVNVFGGVALTAPSDWTIKIQVVSIFGGFSDKRPVNQVDSKKVMIIKGVCLFGGGEIKSIPD